MKRKVIAELLDDDLGTPEEIADSLGDLRHINNWFGGTATTTTLLRRVARETGRTKLSLLEIGAGLGRCAARGAACACEGRHRVAGHTCSIACGRICPRTAASSVSGDAMRLPFCDGAFDVVSCSLFAHHFEPDELLLLVRGSLAGRAGGRC